VDHTILIICLTRFQSLLASMPLVRGIKSQYPNAKVHFVIQQENLGYLQRIPQVDKIFIYSKDATPLALNLLKENYTFLIDLEQSNTSYFLTSYLPHKYKSKTKVLNFPKGGFFQRHLTRKKAFESLTLSSDFIKTFEKSLSILNDGKGWSVNLMETDTLKQDDLPTSHSLGYYCFVVDFDKHNALLRNLLNSIKHPVVLIGKEQAAAMNSLKQINEIQIYITANKFTDYEILQILQNSKLNIIESENSYSLWAALAKKPIIEVGTVRLPLGDLPEYTNANSKNLGFVASSEMPSKLASVINSFL
jgi:hypothetical protein